MDQLERNLVKRAIETRLRRLQLIINETVKPGGDISQMSQDTAARLDELNQIPVDCALLNFALEEQDGLLANLRWLESDEAGLCGYCGTPVPVQRLLSVPTTKLCTQCATREQEKPV